MKKIISQLHTQKQSGFTLLEMLFAVIIFSFALVSLMIIAGRGVIAASTARAQLTAQYLAEELVEVARNMRDENYLTKFNPPGQPSLDVLAPLILECQNGCDIIYTFDAQGVPPRPQLRSCGAGVGGNTSEGQCNELFENEGVFSTDSDQGGTQTTFRRELVVKEAGEDQVILEATVRWKQKALDRTYVLKTALTDWQ